MSSFNRSDASSIPTEPPHFGRLVDCLDTRTTAWLTDYWKLTEDHRVSIANYFACRLAKIKGDFVSGQKPTDPNVATALAQRKKKPTRGARGCGELTADAA